MPDKRPAIPRPQRLTEGALSALERFSHIEAVSGIVLLLAAIVALVWANSPAAATYEHFWNTPITLGLGDYSVSRSLHFLVNDGLMTIFFLVVGAEIRQEIKDGALANLKLATLPLGAALGGVLMPALIYTLLNHAPPPRVAGRSPPRPTSPLPWACSRCWANRFPVACASCCWPWRSSMTSWRF